MNTDLVFEAACLDLEFCTKIWESKETARYPQAEAAYRRAVELRDTYFLNPTATKTPGENIGAWRKSFRAEWAVNLPN